MHNLMQQLIKYITIKGNIAIQGFRKAKLLEKIIEKMYGEEVFLKMLQM